MEDVGVFMPSMLDAALGTFGARYDGLLSKDVARFPTPAFGTYPPLSYSIEAKLGLKEVLPRAVGGLLKDATPCEPYFEMVEEGGRRLPPIPGFSLSCLFSQVIIWALLSRFLYASSSLSFNILIWF